LQNASAAYYSCGKLLISGEYLILRGARGLALPTSKGQHLEVSPIEVDLFEFESLDEQGENWFRARYSLPELMLISSNSEPQAIKLQSLLKLIQQQKPRFFKKGGGLRFISKLDFARDWGLGSSSTFINNLAQWAEMDPFQLSEQSFGGSAYDVVTAQEGQPILYNRVGNSYNVISASISRDLHPRLWFIHMGQKQDSAAEVARFAELSVSDRDIDEVTRLSEQMASTDSLESFENCIERHEILLSRILGTKSASERFADYAAGRVKYLGAWGGDFMLATGRESDMDYFRAQGLHTIIPYKKMIAL